MVTIGLCEEFWQIIDEHELNISNRLVKFEDGSAIEVDQYRDEIHIYRPDNTQDIMFYLDDGCLSAGL